MTLRLEGRVVAERLLAEAQNRVQRGRAEGADPPTLASVHLGESGAFSFYLRQQEKTAREVGIGFRSVALPVDADQSRLTDEVRGLDADPAIHAILVQHPLPARLDFFDAISRLRPDKDVDGVGAPNLGRLVAQRAGQAPAVARAAMAILQHYGIPVAGRRVTVLGRSQTVGLPLALLLASRGPAGDATVTIAHSRTPDLKRTLQDQEIVLSCVGQPNLLTRELVARNTVVIDVGLSSVPDPSRTSGFRGVGDADAASLEGWVEALTPVPGGVGPVTVAQLMANAVSGWERLTRGAR